MAEEAAVFKINELIDALFEQSEETLLRIDVNQKNFERTGKFAPKPNEKNKLMVIHANRLDEKKKKLLLESSPPSPSSSAASTKTLISSAKRSGKSPSTSSLRTKNSVTSQGKSLEYQPSLLPLDPESYEILSKSSLSSLPTSKKDDLKKKKNQKVAAASVSKVFRNLEDGSILDEKQMKEMEKYYKMLQNAEKCNKCSKILVTNSSDASSDSNPSTSIVSPVSSQYSHQTDPFRFKTDSISTSRMSASVITADETTESTFPQSPCQSRPSLCSSKKANVRSPTSASKPVYQSAPSESGISLKFTANVKDPKSGKSHKLNVIAKCLDGGTTPARVYINGKAFGPCQE